MDLRCIGIALLCATALTACSSGIEFKPNRVSKQADAGEVYITGTSIAPWEEYVDRLSQPFSLSPAEALDAVVPQTKTSEERIVESLGARLRASFAPAVTPDTSPAPDLATADGGAATAPPSTIQGTLAPPAATAPEVDPFLRYTAAKALHDEVQLLNTFVRDAAQRHNMVPYITRVQITLAPYARHQPYDTNLVLSFFSERVCVGPKEGAESSCRGQREPGQNETKLKEQFDAKNTGGAVPDKKLGWERGPAVVVPLLVTDNVERQLSFRSRDSIRQLSLALAATQGSIAASLGLDRRFEKLNAILANDFNSLLTVGRPSANAMFVRIGAQTEATSRFATVPRTYNVTLLVMIPEDEIPDGQSAGFDFDRGIGIGDVELISVAGSVTLRDAETGAALPRDGAEDRTALIRKVVSDGSGLDLQPDKARALLVALFVNDFQWFRRTLFDAGFFAQDTRGSAVDMWNVATEELGRSGFVRERFAVPKRAPAALPPPQTMLMVDDGEKTLTVTLRGGQALAGRRFTGSLTMRTKTNSTVTLEAKSVVASAEGLAFAFDSLAAFGIEPKSPETASLVIQESRREGYARASTKIASVGCGTTGRHGKGCYKGALFRKAAKQKAPAPAAAVSLATTAPGISVKDGKGRIDVAVNFAKKGTVPKAAQISVSGGTLVEAKPSNGVSVARGTAPGSVVVGGPTTLSLSFENLVTASDVSVVGVGLDAKGKAIGSADRETYRVY